MRVLHLLDHSVPLHSGYSFRTRSILREQRTLGIETIQVTGSKHAGFSGPVEEVDGFRFHRTSPGRGPLDRLPLFNQYAVVRTLRQSALRLAREIRPDILHAHSPCLNGLAALQASRRLGLPVVYELRASWEDAAVNHGTCREGDLRYRLTRGLETHVLRRADAVTTICEGLREDIEARGIAPEKITVIPNAVDLEKFEFGGQPDADLSRELGIEGHPVIGFIGSFYEYEGLALLLEAHALLLRTHSDARLLLVGGGYEEEKLRERAARPDLASHVVFTGRVPHDRVPAYYDQCSIMAYPRRAIRLTEMVTPLKPLEAMARGRVVVASDIGGHRELIRGGETGLLFPADDASSLAEALGQLLGHPERTAKIRNRARRFVEEERTWARSVARYVSVYEGLARTPKSGS